METPHEQPAATAPPPAESPSDAPAALSAAPKGKLRERGAKVAAFWGDLFIALISPDRPTRRMAILFFLSVLGLAFVTGAGIRRYRQLQSLRPRVVSDAELEKQRLARLADEKEAEARLTESTLKLGRFVIELQGGSGPRGPSADFELVVRCSEKEVREYIEARSVQARSEIMTALMNSSREDFLTVPGKRMTRKKILSQLNLWLAREYPGAKVEELFFTALTVK